MAGSHELTQISLELVAGLMPLLKGVRLAGVTLSNLGPKDAAPIERQQLTLL